MRILQVAASVAESDGGPTTVVLELQSALNRLPGLDAIAVCTDADGNSGHLTREERERLRDCPGLHVLRRSCPYRIKNSWRLARAVWHETRQADVVFVHGLYLAHTFWVWLATRRHRTPYFVFPHGVLEQYQAQFGRRQKQVWDALVGRRVLAGATALVAASGTEASNLTALLPGMRVVEIPLGAASGPRQIGAELEHLLATWLAVPRHERVLFLGRLARKKRPDLLVDAWNSLNSGVLAVVGPDDHWTADQLRSRVRPERIASVVFTGPTDAAGVRWFMSHAGVFVLPSEHENFGITVVEAMSGGAAVITTRQTAASEHVIEAGAGAVLDAPLIEPLVVAIRKLLTDPSAAGAASDAGKRYASQHLTWDRVALQLVEASAPDAQVHRPRTQVTPGNRLERVT